jgi:SAM-dependent MidA family methyltransferase
MTLDDLPPLERDIRHRIAVAGPMPVSEYMSLCLTHPQHGYYVTRDPLGAQGDFITAPEVSQMFGELIGLWAAAVWRQMGSPENVRIVELGPGRGTMMLDMLRAAKVMPGFQAAVVVHFIEISPVLERKQRERFAELDVPVLWHKSLEEAPDGPAIILANEFFDALPIDQAVKQDDGWHLRLIGIDAAGNLSFTVAPRMIPQFDRILPPHMRAAPAGAIYEWRADPPILEVGRRVVRNGGAALIVDYGPAESETGDTLQAVGGHVYADVLTAPGLSDLTAHVDFQALAQAADSMGANVHGPIEQGDFLRRLGIEARAAVLKKKATRETAAQIDAALARLTGGGRTGMGTLFKVLALSDPELGALPGFET